MTKFVDVWLSIAKTLLAQALAGEPELVESSTTRIMGEAVGFRAVMAGDLEGNFSVALDPAILACPLVGEGADQKAGWVELLREVTDAAVGELFAKSGIQCRVEELSESDAPAEGTQGLLLKTKEAAWRIVLHDGVRRVNAEMAQSGSNQTSACLDAESAPRSNVELLLDVELEATLRFGRRELRLGEILDMGPGDVVELDRQVTDPIDLIVGDRIVARGEVVLVNGNFGLRVTEVATPRKRLETVRCLF